MLSLPIGLLVWLLYLSDKTIGFWLVIFPFFLGLVLSLQIMLNQEPKFILSRNETFFYKILIGFTVISFLFQLKLTDIQLLSIRILDQILVFLGTLLVVLIILQTTTYTKYFIDKSSKEFIIIKRVYLLNKFIIKTYSLNDIKNGEIKWTQTGRDRQLILSIYLKDGGTILINSPKLGSDLRSLAYIALHLVKYLDIPITYQRYYFNNSTTHEISPDMMNEQFIHSNNILKKSEELFLECNHWRVQKDGPTTILTGLFNQRRKTALIYSLIDFIFIPLLFICILSYLVTHTSMRFTIFIVIGIIILLLIIIFGIWVISKNIGLRIIKIEPDGIIVGYKNLLRTSFDKKWFYDLIEDISMIQKGSNYLVELKYYISSDILALFQDYDTAFIFRSFLVKKVLTYIQI